MSDSCIGTDTLSTWTQVHGTSGTPSSQLLLEEIIPQSSTQFVFTCIRFCNSPYIFNETNMLSGSTGGVTGGKPISTGAQEGVTKKIPKGARPKEDAGHRAYGSDPLCTDNMSRELPPPPFKTCQTCIHVQEHYCLLFSIEVVTALQEGASRLFMLPPYTWTKRTICDILSPTIMQISQIIVLNPMECLNFQGHRDQKEKATPMEKPPA